jgi:hypothetical protein
MAEDEEKNDEEKEKKEKPPEAKPISKQPDYPPPPGYGYGPQADPFFSAKNLHKILAIGLLIGIICLFIGAMAAAGGKFIKVEKEDDADLQRNLSAVGHLMGGVGLFLVALFVLLPFLMIKDLSDKQKNMLILLFIAILIGFTILASSGPAFSFSF